MGKNAGVGFHALLQGIFPTQGSNPGPPDCLLSEPPRKPQVLYKHSVHVISCHSYHALKTVLGHTIITHILQERKTELKEKKKK